MATTIVVKHNIEMAHRLWKIPGKCTQIHGHSWWVEARLWVEPDEDGFTIDFSVVKKTLRKFLDETYDHHLALDMHDPLFRGLSHDDVVTRYPGVVLTDGMATVENMAKWIGTFMQAAFPEAIHHEIMLWEAATNGAEWCP